jgi:hypothetical protein
MMALTDHNRETLEDRPLSFRKILLSMVLGLIVLIALAAASGAIVALVHGADRPVAAAAVSLAALALAGAAGWGIARLRPWAGSGGPVGPKTRRARTMFAVSAILGGALAALLVFGTWGGGELGGLATDQPLPQWLAAAVAAIWLIAVPVISWIWFRSVDEHEAQSYTFGGTIALHIYYIALPAWWIAWRGGFLPAPHHGILFWIVTVAWLAGWAWRRYR